MGRHALNAPRLAAIATPRYRAVMAQIDLNADVGEGMALDAGLLGIVTSANVACGGHAGDRVTIRATLKLAREHGVTVGAHPGWPDRGHFGRQRLTWPVADLRATFFAQIADLQGAALETGWPVRYVKLHGALANQVAEDEALAQTVAAWVRETGLGWLVMARTAMERAAERAGVPARLEAFADRSYTPQGLLTPRDQPNAVLHEPNAVAARALMMLERQALPLADGTWLPTRIDSLCVHGDTPDALVIAQTLRIALQGAGWQVKSLQWPVCAG